MHSRNNNMNRRVYEFMPKSQNDSMSKHVNLMEPKFEDQVETICYSLCVIYHNPDNGRFYGGRSKRTSVFC